jgi:iron complex transport system ATP-binding protein
VRALRGRIGYTSAALARLLHPDLTALEAVATGRTGVLDPYWAAPGPDDLARAGGLLERLGCARLAHHPLGTLSEGERQRVQIARALMADPDVLLLDEPSAGLDLGARELLVESLSGLARDPAVRAIAFVTHHAEEVPAGFTHALLLRGGRVLAAGPLEGTLTAPLLTACFGLPLHVAERRGRWAAWAPGPDVVGPARPDPQADPGPPGLVRDPDGRLKAHRPLGDAERLEALERFMSTYAAGGYFDAHEILEPAWMGTDDTSERALHQGLIKVAAAGVHAARGNAEGVRRNLEGASRRLALVPQDAGGTLGEALARVDLPAVRDWVAAALAALAAVEGGGDAPRAVAGLVAAAPAPVRRGPTP